MTTDQLIPPRGDADVFTELLDWITQIESLTRTIRSRIEEANQTNER